MFREVANRLTSDRPLVGHAIGAGEASLLDALHEEESQEREKDAEYWAPLKLELERLREQRRTT